MNCGEKLLDKALVCPVCGKSVKNSPIIDKNDTSKIEEIISSVPHPEKRAKPKWKKGYKGDFKPNGTVYCPKCHSTVIQTSARGYSPLSGIFGALFLGFIGSFFGLIGTIVGTIIGILCGFSGSKKVRITCLKCGHKFYPGKR
jgi:ABC-type dipeptide/oligopeptide/nickel transport system permease subunit